MNAAGPGFRSGRPHGAEPSPRSEGRASGRPDPVTGRPLGVRRAEVAPEGGDRRGFDAGRAVYVISVAAELAGVHPQTLRVYERRGLLDPSRTSGGSRRFSERDLVRLRRIQDLTAAGLNLEGVRRVLELEAEVALLRSELERARLDARESVERVHRQYRRELVPLDQSPIRFIPVSRARARR